MQHQSHEIKQALIRLLRGRIILAFMGIIACMVKPQVAVQIASIVGLGIGVSAVEAYRNNSSTQNPPAKLPQHTINSTVIIKDEDK